MEELLCHEEVRPHGSARAQPTLAMRAMRRVEPVHDPLRHEERVPDVLQQPYDRPVLIKGSLSIEDTPENI
jgi:hypothetical protein